MEIDLTKTPLSEIDLSKINYEKSYVMFKGNKYLIIENTLKQSSYEHDFVLYSLDSKPWRGFLFYPDGKHYYNKATIHLFYKEEKGCGNCQYICTLPYNDPCYKCDTINHPFWQPKEVKERPAGEWKQVNSHPIIIEYQDLGDTVKILKIEGVMTIDEIIKHAGDSVLSQYADGEKRPSMHMSGGSLYVWCKKDNQFYYHFINHGDKIKKESFADLIDNMKLSAKRLASLIKDSKEPKIERIII
jgi:hypothetical protein